MFIACLSCIFVILLNKFNSIQFISGKFVQFWSSLGLHSFKFRRVLTATRQQWTPDSHSELDFDGFVTVEFGENGHFAANLAPETMWD